MKKEREFSAWGCFTFFCGIVGFSMLVAICGGWIIKLFIHICK